MEVITNAAIQRRKYWVAEIEKISENFGGNSARLESELSAEIKKEGQQALLDHLRLRMVCTTTADAATACCYFR